MLKPRTKTWVVLSIVFIACTAVPADAFRGDRFTTTFGSHRVASHFAADGSISARILDGLGEAVATLTIDSTGKGQMELLTGEIESVSFDEIALEAFDVETLMQVNQRFYTAWTQYQKQRTETESAPKSFVCFCDSEVSEGPGYFCVFSWCEGCEIPSANGQCMDCVFADGGEMHLCDNA